MPDENREEIKRWHIVVDAALVAVALIGMAALGGALFAAVVLGL